MYALTTPAKAAHKEGSRRVDPQRPPLALPDLDELGIAKQHNDYQKCGTNYKPPKSIRDHPAYQYNPPNI